MFKHSFCKKYFLSFVSVLFLSGSISLGVSPHPSAQTVERPHVKSTIIKLLPSDHLSGELEVLTPEGTGPFPVAFVREAGSGSFGFTKPGFLHVSLLSGYFLSRHYAVVRFHMTRRGGQIFVGSPQACDFAGTSRADTAEENSLAIRTLADQSSLDMRHIVLAGAGHGGWETLASNQEKIPEVQGILVLGPTFKTDICPAGTDKAFVNGAEQFGKANSLPTFWVEGRANNPVSETVWRAMVGMYSHKNDHLSLVDLSTTPSGYYTFLGYGQAFPYWSVKADEFLKHLSLPSGLKDAAYVEPIIKENEAESLAKIDDIQALPDQSDKAIQAYKEFLKKPFPRAFAIGENGTATAWSERDPARHALETCSTHSKSCHLYAYNDRVLWKSRLPADTQVYHVRVDPKGDISLFLTSLKPDCSVDFLPKIRVVKQPLHGTLTVWPDIIGTPHYTAPSPLARCNKATHGSSAQYRPAAGYKGKDTMLIEREVGVKNPHYQSIILNIDVL
ncbi:hypothetical protein [Acetobacter indonesiensis]|uniref:hypothetical protein n=1 Tax=Acetobacter indonesiensis TaxID=104101 RepID=UPI0039EB5115